MKNITRTGLIAVAVIASLSAYAKEQTVMSTTKTTSMTTSMTTDQQQSYSVGYTIGKSLATQSKATDQAFNYQALIAGMNAGFNGKKPAMTDEQMKTVMENMQKEAMAKMKQKQEEISQANLKASTAYMAKIAKESEAGLTQACHNKTGCKPINKIAKGLYYKVLVEGHGPKPKGNDSVTVNYEGKLIDGKIFDSSYARKKSATFKLNQVISGWTKALQHMPQGSVWEIYIAPDLAYGSTMAPPSIGPNQALTFKVDLIKVNATDQKKPT